LFTVNANKYHVHTILEIFQAYLFTVSFIIHSEILRKIQFWKLKTKWSPFGERKCNKFLTYFGHNSLISGNFLTNETLIFSAENNLSYSVANFKLGTQEF